MGAVRFSRILRCNPRGKVALVMSNQRGGAEPAESANELKSIFERSLAVLREEGSFPKDSQSRRTLYGSLPLHTDAADIRKRALDAAAKALASLWRIRKPALPGRVAHSDR